MDSEKSLQRVVKYIESGNLWRARSLLRRLQRNDPKNEYIYILFAQAAETVEQSKYCLSQALKINPKNQIALNLIRKKDPRYSRVATNYGSMSKNDEQKFSRYFTSGNQSPSIHQSTANWKPILLVIGVIVILIAFCSGGLSDTGCDEAAAFVAAENVVRSRLKSPSSAKFPIASSGYVSKTSTGYRINSWVEAENSFGANLRVSWSATVAIDSDGRCVVKSVGISD